MKKRSLVLGLLLYGAGLMLEAGQDWPCQADAEKFCKDVKPGEGRLIACLKAHESELSAACRQTMAQKKEEFKGKKEQFKGACESDVQQFCKDVKPGEGRIIQCLKQHEAQLSSGCRETLSKKGRSDHKK